MGENLIDRGQKRAVLPHLAEGVREGNILIPTFTIEGPEDWIFAQSPVEWLPRLYADTVSKMEAPHG
jgi:hypothetical protein